MSITLEEGLGHLSDSAGRPFLDAPREDVDDNRPHWFTQIDSNNDGVIRPQEFDQDLDEAKVLLFARRN
jgi:hypothetical protein